LQQLQAKYDSEAKAKTSSDDEKSKLTSELKEKTHLIDDLKHRVEEANKRNIELEKSKQEGEARLKVRR